MDNPQSLEAQGQGQTSQGQHQGQGLTSQDQDPGYHYQKYEEQSLTKAKWKSD